MINVIAREAKVSTATVSKALNDYPDISQETKDRVKRVADRLNYTPNVAARNLASKKSKIIGLIFSGIKDTDSNGNIIFRLYMGAKKTCEDYGYEIIMISTDRLKQSKKLLKDLCREQMLAGYIIYGLTMTDPYYNQIIDTDVPGVAIDLDIIIMENNPLIKGRLSVVTTDNATAIDEIIEILINKGHKEIGFINGLAEAEISVIRENAYKKALEKWGITIKSHYIRYADFLEVKAYEEAKILIIKNPSITAIFCASDLMAIGVYKALGELGKSIPEDIAVVGFDGIQISEYVTPKLTTVVQDFRGMVKKAVEKVIAQINGEKHEPISYVPYQIRIRDSI